jgi:uncharacterized protein (DUF433 family)
MREPFLIGLGIYTVPEAARLTHVSEARIRRWLAGRPYPRAGVAHASGPLWRPELPRFDGKLELSFRDLIEVRFVDLFLEHGLSLQAIRRAITKAVQQFGLERPLSTQRFRTDGRSIFLEVVSEMDEALLFDLKRNRYLFHRMVAPSFRDIDFDGGLPARWWPVPGRKGIVVDPKRSFGKPILADHGVPVAALADAYKVRRSFKLVGRDYDVPERAVRQAVDFQERLAA